MIQGKILKISWNGLFDVVLDGTRKRFKDWESMYAWFGMVLAHAKDDKKRALLLNDLKPIMEKKT